MISSIDAILPPYTYQSFAKTSVYPNFSFYIDGKTYKCQAFLLCSLSKLIESQVLSQHPVYSFEFKDIKDPNNFFDIFMSMLNGNSCEINHSNAIFLNHIANSLQIDSLISATQPYLSVPINTSNALQLLTSYSELNINCPHVVKFIHSNFQYFQNDPQKQLSQLSLNSLHFLFGSNEFKIKDENAYYKFVSKLIEDRGDEFSALFAYSNLAKLSHSQMNEIINFVSIDSFTNSFIDAIGSRFVKNVDPKSMIDQISDQKVQPQNVSNQNLKPKTEQPSFNQLFQNQLIQKAQQPQPAVYNSTSIPKPQNSPQTEPQNVNNNKPPVNHHQSHYTSYDQNNYYYEEDFNEEEEGQIDLHYRGEKDEFNGVFAFFKKDYPPYDFSQYVQVTAGGDHPKQAYHLFDYDDIWSFHWNTYSTRDYSIIQNAWLMIHFPYHRLLIDHYTLASTCKVQNKMLDGLQPKSWKLEGSNDQQQWTLLSLVRNSIAMKEVDAVATFPTKSQEHFSYFKLTLIENGAKPTKPFANQLKLNAIEFYGYLEPLPY